MEELASLAGNWGYPTSIRFGAGRVRELPDACRELGVERPLLVTDPGVAALPMVAGAVDACEEAGLDCAVFADVCGNPVEANVRSGVAAFRAGDHDGVIAFGGGSALDTGKAIALMVGQSRPIWDFEDREDWETVRIYVFEGHSIGVPEGGHSMARHTREGRRIRDELLDELLAGDDPAEVFRSGRLVDALKKAVAERALDAEMDAHLEHESASGNHRKRAQPQAGADRRGCDGAGGAAGPRGALRAAVGGEVLPAPAGFDDKVLSMYARGMTTREIRAHVEELYGVSVSAELISKVTDAVLEEVGEWQSRPLEEVYAIVYFDAVRVKVRDEGLVRNKAVYLAIGVTCAGRKEILGLWIEHTEGAKFWLSVMNELKARGVGDVLIAVVDGLKGFPEAVEAVFPQVTVQTCIVHLIRRSLAMRRTRSAGGWRERSRRSIGRRRGPRPRRHWTRSRPVPGGRSTRRFVRSWRSAWEQVVPFFAFSQPIRRAVYTTNAIESLNSTVRRAVRTRGHFPNDRAAAKLIYLALRGVERKWRAPPLYWHQVRPELAIRFGERFVVEPS